MKRTTLYILMLVATLAFAEKPLMKDFMGINGHYPFKPEVYNKVCNQARNYHNINWDAKKIGDPIQLPIAVNGVMWESMYKNWKDAGFETDICAQFGTFSEDNKDYKTFWTGQEKWIYDYGYQMAKVFGPSGKGKYCTAIEIGNEPGNDFDDDLYQEIFINMAKGIRAGDPKVKIVTCTVQAREADKYSKNLSETFSSPEIKKLFDVINVHTYAIKPKSKDYSPWDRSYPEDPTLDYLKVVNEAIDWRNKYARGKEIWVTEFGWDSVTPDVMNKRTGWALKLNWQGVTDLQQAQYIVRAYLCFAEMDVQKAYVYFYDDKNSPSVHAAAGLTRNGTPKMSYWAVKQLYETLGDFRFNKIIKKSADAYIFEFVNPKKLGETVWVAWSPTGSEVEKEIVIPRIPGRLMKAENMQTTEAKNSTSVTLAFQKDRSLKLLLTESPVYLSFIRR
ncbi:MAG: hypothetical protein PF692_07720 [Kiritimatiellae bacterium]|jgi:hypothetical protein|nr:hypothetical protein [Kiritimatiellia bacterium]